MLLCPLIVLGLGACGGGGDDSPAGGDEARPAAERGGGSASSPGGCRPVDPPPPKRDGGQKKPSKRLDSDRSYSATVATNCGEFTIALDVEASPHTTASFVALAKDGFFEGTVFHRIVPGFVIQGGDPTGTGTGGPGYKTVDEPPSDTSYEKGIVAMAKSPNEPPGTAGSQFFVVTGDNVGLSPEFALLGEISAGLDVVERIGRLGDSSQRPTEPVVIEDVSVDES